MVQCLKAPAALPKDLGVVPEFTWQLAVVCNFILRKSDTLYWPPRASSTPVVHRPTDRQAKYPYTSK